MIKVQNTVMIYEVDGDNRKADGDSMLVHSHWNRSELVVIEAAGKRMTVNARDLEVAIANAKNSGRF